MAAAMACFAAMDTATKILSATVPLLMVVWVRYVVQLLVLSAALLPRRGRALLRTRRPGLQVVRALMVLATSFVGFIGIKAMPLAEFTSIVLLTPLALTVVSALGRRESVPGVRWLCVAGGLAGALVVLRPGGVGTAQAACLAVLIVVVNTAHQWMTSHIARIEDAGTTQFYAGLVGALVTSWALPFAWQGLPDAQWGLLLLVGLLGMAGHQLLIHAYGLAPGASLAPCLYLQLAFATLAGWLVFSHAPDAWTLTGVGLIGASGIVSALADRWRRHELPLATSSRPTS